MVKVTQKSLPFSLSLVFHLHPKLTNWLNFVSMAYAKGFMEDSKSIQEHKYILIIIIIIVTMIMNGIA